MTEQLRPPMACNHGEDGQADCDALRAEVCKVRGHTDPERKFRGELLCRRCRHVIGHW